MDNIVEKIIAKKAELGVTNAWIAEKSGVPESTVTKVLNGTNKSPQMATIIPIAEVLGVPISQYTAEQPNPEAPARTPAERTYDEYILNLLRDSYEQRIKDKDEQNRILRRWIYVLAGALALIFAAVLFICIYDITHPDRGWYQQMADYYGNFTGKIAEFLKNMFAV